MLKLRSKELGWNGVPYAQWKADQLNAIACMNIRIVNYTLSARPQVQALVSVEIDGWLRFNGLNLLRSGALESAKLTPMIKGKRLFIDAVQILDAELSRQITTDILAAIHKHVALLPPERRSRLPIERKPVPAERPPAPLAAAPPPKAKVVPAPLPKPKAAPAPKPLPPPQRLLAGLR